MPDPLPASPAPDARGIPLKTATIYWRDPSETPPTPAGEEAEYLAALRRKGQQKVFTIAARHLNAFPLDFEDGCGDCPDDGTHDEGCPTTGWYSAESHSDYAAMYNRLLYSGDELVAWAEIPNYVESAP